MSDYVLTRLYSTKEAAEYLDITVQGMWYHIKHGNLKPTKVGKTLVFAEDQLDEFQKNRRPAGRPKQEDK